jgi:phenylacetic acid degradation operon negative regulatory protein
MLPIVWPSGATVSAPSSIDRTMAPEPLPSSIQGARPRTDDSPDRQQRPQDLVITILGQYTDPSGGPVWSGGLVQLLTQLGFSQGASRVALNRLVNRELLARIRDGRLVYYQCTEAGKDIIGSHRQRADELARPILEIREWTVVRHTLPEEMRPERGLLARRLRAIGFGSPQDGTWLSPHNHEAEAVKFVHEADAAPHATVLVGAITPWSETEQLIGRAWDLAELTSRYRDFVSEFGRFAAPDGEPPDDQTAFIALTGAVFAFQEYASLDPNLPGEYMPNPAIRLEALDLYRNLQGDLAAAAQRHFDAVFDISGKRLGPAPNQR